MTLKHSPPLCYIIHLNSPVDIMSSQLRFVPGAFLHHQRLFHLLEVGFNVFLCLREDVNALERADYLLWKKKVTFNSKPLQSKGKQMILRI